MDAKTWKIRRPAGVKSCRYPQGQRPEPAAALFDGLHDVEKVSPSDRARRSLLGDDDHVSWAKLIEELVELRGASWSSR